MPPEKFEPSDWRELMAVAAAIKLGIFTAVAESRPTAAELASELGYDPRAAETLLLALQSLGHLELDAGRYSVPPGTARFVTDSASPDYAPNGIVHQWNLMERWLTIPEVVRAGRQVPRPYTSERRQVFIKSMDDYSRGAAARIVELCLSRKPDILSVLDIGGGPGTYSRLFADRGIEVTIQDRPEVVEMMSPELKPWPRIRMVAGDFNERLPEGNFDLVFMGNIFHIYSPEENRSLLGRVRGALNPGGLIAIVDLVRGRSSRAPVFALTMLVNTDGGGTWTEDQYRAWLTEAGFSGIEVHDIRERDSQLILAEGP